jgi:hypothetical protein
MGPALHRPRGHYAFAAHACTPATPREKGSAESGVRHHDVVSDPAVDAVAV